jgi:hypothetical protein
VVVTGKECVDLLDGCPTNYRSRYRASIAQRRAAFRKTNAAIRFAEEM